MTDFRLISDSVDTLASGNFKVERMDASVLCKCGLDGQAQRWFRQGVAGYGQAVGGSYTMCEFTQFRGTRNLVVL